MNNLEVESSGSDLRYKFAVVAQSPAIEDNILSPLTNTESGRRFSMWLEAADLLGIPYYITNAIKTLKKPGETVSKEEQANDLAKLKSELQPFKHVITLGKIASNSVAMLKLSAVVLELPHPSGLNRKLNNPKAIMDVIQALQEFKKKL